MLKGLQGVPLPRQHHRSVGRGGHRYRLHRAGHQVHRQRHPAADQPGSARARTPSTASCASTSAVSRPSTSTSCCPPPSTSCWSPPSSTSWWCCLTTSCAARAKAEAAEDAQIRLLEEIRDALGGKDTLRARSRATSRPPATNSGSAASTTRKALGELRGPFVVVRLVHVPGFAVGGDAVTGLGDQAGEGAQQHTAGRAGHRAVGVGHRHRAVGARDVDGEGGDLLDTGAVTQIGADREPGQDVPG